MRRYLSLGITLVLAGGCGGDPFSQSEERALAAAEEKWQAAALGSYTFEYRLTCFCEVAYVQWMRIAVEAGGVAEVVYVDSTDVALETEGWPTVDELFERIDHLREDGSSNVSGVDLEFDATLGYPTLINVVMDRGIADGGATHEARNLSPAP